MNTTPEMSQVTERDQQFATSFFHWAAFQRETGASGNQVKAIIELVGVALRSMDKRELKQALEVLGVYGKLGKSGGTDASEVFDHEHDEWDLVDDQGPIDSLPTWKVYCTHCKEERRIVRP